MDDIYLIYLVLIIITSFKSATSNYQFQCHCADDSECVSDRSFRSASCPSGCKSVDASGENTGDMWGGPGCQVGNIVNSSKIVFLSYNFLDRESSIKGFMNRKKCYAASDIDHFTAYFEFPIVMYNVSFDIKSDQTLNNRDEFYMYTYPNLPRFIEYTYSNDTLTFKQNNSILVHYLDIHIRADITVLCNLIVIGYQYIECKPFKNDFYYGPGCLLKCKNCAVQCDMISGHCPLCTKTSTGRNCKNCLSSYWGEKCEKLCYCENENCLDETGECPLTGCAKEYIGTSCDYMLPNINHTTPIIKFNKSGVIISLHEINDTQLNTSFVIEYRTTDMRWKQTVHKYNIHEIRRGELFSYPENITSYDVRVRPFDLQYSVFGIASNYVQININLDFTRDLSRFIPSVTEANVKTQENMVSFSSLPKASTERHLDIEEIVPTHGRKEDVNKDENESKESTMVQVKNSNTNKDKSLIGKPMLIILLCVILSLFIFTLVFYFSKQICFKQRHEPRQNVRTVMQGSECISLV